MPLPAIWGPRAWELLHGIGWRAGRCSIPRLAVDEQREVLWLLTHIDYILPCPECKRHYIEYKKQNSLPEESKEVGAWLWTFHEAVNERLGKGEGPPFTKNLGEKKPLLQLWKDYVVLVQESFHVGHLRRDQVKEWSRHFYVWLSIAQ